MKIFKFIIVIFLVTFFVTSCDTNPPKTTHGAIILGDSSTIVTETDSNFLSDNVHDFEPVLTSPPEAKDSIQKEVVIDTPQKALTETTSTTKSIEKNIKEGLQVPFKDAELFIAGIKAKLGQNPNWEKAHSAAYTVLSGTLEGKMLQIDFSKVTSVKQRIQTVVMLETSNGKKFELTALGDDESSWEELKLQKGGVLLKGFEQNSLKFENKFNPALLKQAVQKMARQNRMNRKDLQNLLNDIRKVNKPNQHPCSIALQSVVWKINGLDKNGKSVERSLRLDFSL